MRWLARRYLPAFKKYLVLGPVAKTLEVCFDLVTPLVVAWMVDSGVRQGDTDVVVRGGALLALMAALGFSVTLICQKMASLASQGVGTRIRDDLFAQALRLAPADMDRFGSASLLTRLTNDVNQLQLAVALLIRQAIRWPALALGSLVCALLLDWQLGLVFCVCMPLIALVFYLVMRRSVPYFAAIQAQLDRLALLVHETAAGIRPIRVFGRVEHERQRFAEAAQTQARTVADAGALAALLGPATVVVMNLGVVALLWLGGFQVQTGRLEQGQVMALIGYMNQLLVSIVFIANLVTVFTKAGTAAGRVAEVLRCEPSVSDQGNRPCDPVPGAPLLELRAASLTYPRAARPALQDVSLTLDRGEVLGVIGSTGSGKSSLAALPPRFYDATAGEVLVEGVDVRAYPFKQLRGLVAVVPQKASLVSGTIASNLRWRDEEATPQQLWQALETAQAAEFVREKPAGLDEPVEAGGRNFSGGQRQRLAIARALVGRPALLMLDDPVSALDYRTELALRRALRRLPWPCGLLLVSQRVSTVRQADRICVLDQGRVVGLGSHESLVRSCEVYRQICATQLRQEEEAFS